MVSMLRQIGGTALVGIVARLFTVVIPFVAVRVFGLGGDTDSYFLAAAVILFWTTSVAPVLETGIISEFVTEPGRAGWSRIFHLGVRFSLLAAGMGVLAATALSLAPEQFVEPSLAGRTREILLELSPLLIISIWNSLLVGWLNARRRFRSPAMSPAFIGIAVLASLYTLTPYLGIHALVVGYLAGESLRFLYLGGRVLWTQPRDTTNGPGSDPLGPGSGKRGLDAMTLQWLCLVLIALNPVVDRFLAGGLGVGSISVLELVERLVMIPVGLVTWAVLPIVTAKLAKQVRDPQVFNASLRRILIAGLAVGASVSLVLAGIHGWLFEILFTNGQRPWPEYGNLAFLCLVAGLPFQISALLLWRVAVILNRPGSIFAFAGAMAFSINLVVDVIAMGWWGLPGITLATSVTFFLFSAVLWKYGSSNNAEKDVTSPSCSD